MKTGNFVVVYDISQDKERSKVDKILLGYGFRTQKSVFECVLNETDRIKMINNLQKLDIKSGFIKIYKQEYCFPSIKIGKETIENPDENHVFAF